MVGPFEDMYSLVFFSPEISYFSGRCACGLSRGSYDGEVGFLNTLKAAHILDGPHPHSTVFVCLVCFFPSNFKHIGMKNNE